jgi:hypothetical protein
MNAAATPPIEARDVPLNDSSPRRYIAFSGMQRIAAGALVDVAIVIQRVVDSGQHPPILLFEARTSELVEVDTRGSVDEVARRYASPSVASAPSDDASAADTSAEGVADGPRPRGRPKLGVVAREVTLLPRHWEWLNAQPGGASVALRKLVEEARRANAGRDAARSAREAAYKFMSAIASGLETFEEATRALFAGDRPRFEGLVSIWPADVREHVLGLAQGSFQ